MLALLLACFTAPDAPIAPDPVPSIPATREPDRPAPRYVHASLLNLRKSEGGEVIGQLAINTPLEVLSAEGSGFRVRVDNGKEGWVGAAFLGDRALSSADAKARAAEATEPADRLAWLQRAVAIDTRDREALRGLADAYRLAGDARRAAKVERQLAWPQEIRLAGSHPQPEGRVALEWSSHYDPPEWSTRPEVLSAEQMARLGVAPGQRVWVLPSAGAAVEGALVDVEHRAFNECGGSMGFVLHVDAALPAGERPVAYTVRDPPSSWRVPAPTPDLAPYDARALAEGVARDMPDPAVHAVALDRSVLAYVVSPLPPQPEFADVPTAALLSLSLTPTEVRVIDHEPAIMGYLGIPVPSVGRDIDGDGQLDALLEGDCAQTVVDDEGAVRAQTHGLCCGC